MNIRKFSRLGSNELINMLSGNRKLTYVLIHVAKELGKLNIYFFNV